MIKTKKIAANIAEILNHIDIKNNNRYQRDKVKFILEGYMQNYTELNPVIV